MLFDFVARVVLLVKMFSASTTNSTSQISSPSNLSQDEFFNYGGVEDTVIIDNPYMEDDSYQGLITLPICCKFKPGDDIPSCPGVDDWQENYEVERNNHYDHDHDEDDEGYWYPAPHLFPSENRSHYKFEVRRPSCSSPLKVVKLSTDEFEVGNQGRFTPNGYFGYNREEFFSPLEYCISGLTGEFVQVMICDSGKCAPEEGRPCIQKCCNPDEIYSFSRRQCIKSKGALFRPIFYHDLSHKLSASEGETILPHYHIAFPRSFKHHCMENKTLIIPAGDAFAHHLSNLTNKSYYSTQLKIRQDGSIMYRQNGKAIVVSGSPVYRDDASKRCYTLQSTSHYCIDGAAEYGSPNHFNNDEGEIFLVTCPEFLTYEPLMGPLSFAYGNVMITSSVFSLLTFVVYIVLREKQNIHGWTIASYAFSVFLMYIFQGLAHLIRYYWPDDVLSTAGCVTIGIASHLFSMSSFLWLTLMNWDIWWTFRKVRPSLRKTKGKELKHFLTYSLFGWGIPIFIAGISTFLHFRFEESSVDDCAVVGVPLPAYGRESCEIKQLSLGVYLYFPAAALLTCNLLFFIVTTFTLCKQTKQTQLATKNLERHHQSAQLFAKLFFVMGVTRVFEVISWAESGPTLTWYWAVFDCFNILQAVAVFIIYVCKKDVVDSLKKFSRQLCFGQAGQLERKSRQHLAASVVIGSRRTVTITSAGSADTASTSVPLLNTSPEGQRKV